MTTVQISIFVAQHFIDHYVPFKQFRYSPTYQVYWDKCMQALTDGDLLSHIIFCNDLFKIPPIKTFLCYYAADFIAITGDDRAVLDDNVKKGIGAFWGMVFKYVLGYTVQESVSVSMNKLFVVKTAACFSNPRVAVSLDCLADETTGH